MTLLRQDTTQVFEKLFKIIYTYVLYECVQMSAGALRGWSYSMPPELDLQGL